jgi:Domain of unknown function (DUF4760)
MEIMEALLADYHPWLLGLGFLAVFAAFLGVFTQRLLARRNSTIELIYRLQTNAETLEDKRQFLALEKEHGRGGLAKFADAEHEGSNDAKVILNVLNQFELIAIGIEVGSLDYEIYKRYNKTNSISYYHRAAPFIHALRARLGNDAIYHEFEQLTWWLKDKKMPRRNRWRGVFF